MPVMPVYTVQDIVGNPENNKNVTKRLKKEGKKDIYVVLRYAALTGRVTIHLKKGGGAYFCLLCQNNCRMRL